MATDVLDAANDALAAAEHALAALRSQYEKDPRNYELGRRVGELTHRMVTLKRARAPKPVYVKPEPTVFWDGRQWDEAVRLAGHCPLCAGWPAHAPGLEEPLPLRGYSIRYGETGAKCLVCDGTFSLEGS